jgi:3-keto-5-aminohexanoate cleavage enzyme
MAKPLEPLIVMVAPNGARRGKADHPAIPVGPAEMAATAAACQASGAAMIHLHVRDAAGAHSIDPATYRQAIAAIRAEVGDKLIVQVTSEAAGRFKPPEQMAMVRALKPEAVSLAMREIIPDAAAESAGAAFLAEVAKGGTLVQYILYSAAEVTRFRDLMHRGVVPQARPAVLYVLGNYRDRTDSDPTDLLPFLAAANETQWPWWVCSFGRREGACAVAAASLGGHPRVGFENNLWLADGSVAPDNAALISQAAKGAALLGRPLADADQARALLRSN